MRTAVIYARYSSDSQTEQSIEGQLRVCEDYAQRNNILILKTYIDRAMTGTNDNRPDFQQMIKDSARREWEAVIVYKLDRFSRNKYESTVHKRTLKNNGVKVISAMENIPDTPEGIILESLLEGMNQYFSAELSQKVKRGMRENRRKGLYQGGGVPYGYKVENQRLVIDDMKAEVVRYMYEQYSKGVYVREIIATLTARGITYKGRPFAPNTVYDILKNDKYLGVYTRGEEVVDNMYPSLIDKDLFESVRKIVNANKFGKRSIKAVYLLRGKLKCGYCGRPISAESGSARNGETIHYYKCIGRKKDRNGCKKTILRKEYLEELIINTTLDELSNPQIMDRVIAELIKIQNRQITENTALRILSGEKSKVSKALQNLLTAIENGIISNTTNKRLHELEEQEEELERQILLEKAKTAIKVPESIMREYYRQALLLEPQMLINYLIKEIVLYDDRIEIYYNSPLTISPDESQGFLFYKGFKKMRYIIWGSNQIKLSPIDIELHIK